MEFWWESVHESIPRNEQADVAAKFASDQARTGNEEFYVSRGSVEGLLYRWYQDQAKKQERTLVGTRLDETEDSIIRTELQWI